MYYYVIYRSRLTRSGEVKVTLLPGEYGLISDALNYLSSPYIKSYRGRHVSYEIVEGNRQGLSIIVHAPL